DINRAGLLHRLDIVCERRDADWFLSQCDNLGLVDKLQLHSPSVSVRRGCVTLLAYLLRDLLHHDEDSASPLPVVVSRQSTAQVLPDAGAKYRLRWLPALNRLTLSDLLVDDSRSVDLIAIREYLSLHEHCDQHVYVQDWANRLVELLPVLKNPFRRRMVLSTSRFSRYGMLLGLEHRDKWFIYTRVLQPRPRPRDLLQVYKDLSGSRQRCLFLHWANEVQSRFPVLRKAPLRAMLFGGHNRLDSIAASIGLVRRDRWLVIASREVTGEEYIA
ncbi:hypothetical protein D6833_02820, partial [Candidatus Parcubacteria bacterium]